MDANKKSPQTISRYVRGTFSSLFRFGKSKYRKWCLNNPITDEGEVKEHFKSNVGIYTFKGTPNQIKPEQIESLFESCKNTQQKKGETWNQREFYFFVLLAVREGTRRWEILTLQVNQVNLEGKFYEVTAENAKTTKTRKVFFNFAPEIGELFAELMEGKQPEERIFKLSVNQIKYRWKRVMGQAKLSGFTLRDLRKAASKWMESKGIKLSVACSNLGTSGEMLARTYNLQTDDETRKELEKLA